MNLRGRLFLKQNIELLDCERTRSKCSLWEQRQSEHKLTALHPSHYIYIDAPQCSFSNQWSVDNMDYTKFKPKCGPVERIVQTTYQTDRRLLFNPTSPPFHSRNCQR